MLTIIWSYKGKENRATYKNCDKDIANAVWRELKNCPDITDLRTEKTEDQEAVEKKIAVRIKFDGYAKIYTYLAHSKVNTGDKVVVDTHDGLRIVTVVECAMVTTTELEKICPTKKFSYIRGKLIA